MSTRSAQAAQAASDRAKNAVLGREAGNSDAVYTQAFIGAQKAKCTIPVTTPRVNPLLPW